jgi:hypothetical protein
VSLRTGSGCFSDVEEFAVEKEEAILNGELDLVFLEVEGEAFLEELHLLLLFLPAFLFFQSPERHFLLSRFFVLVRLPLGLCFLSPVFALTTAVADAGLALLLEAGQVSVGFAVDAGLHVDLLPRFLAEQAPVHWPLLLSSRVPRLAITCTGRLLPHGFLLGVLDLDDFFFFFVAGD